jgi:hypothetical protein
MYLIMCLFWLIVAIGLFLLPVINPQAGRLTIANTGIPFAWLAAFFACYSFLRWLLNRLRNREKQKLNQPSGRPRPRPEEHIPDFDFTDQEKTGEPGA